MRNLATHTIFPNIQEIPITQTVQNVWYSNPEIYLAWYGRVAQILPFMSVLDKKFKSTMNCINAFHGLVIQHLK